MENETSALPNLPNVALKEISKHLSIQELLRLRKMSPKLRESIDEIAVLGLDSICVSNFGTKCQLMISKSHGRRHYFAYENDENGCTIRLDRYKENKETHFENENYLDMMCNDLAILLKLQKSTLNEFQVGFGKPTFSNTPEFSNKLLHIMQTLKLKTTKVQTTIFKSDHAMSILPYLDSDFLKSITIQSASDVKKFETSEEKYLKLDEIVQLDQWERAEDLAVFDFFVSNDFGSFEHATYVDIKLETVECQDLIGWKEKFLQHPQLLQTTLYYQSAITEHMSKLFGPIDPPKTGSMIADCCFEIPESDNILYIVWWTSLIFQISRSKFFSDKVYSLIHDS